MTPLFQSYRRVVFAVLCAAFPRSALAAGDQSLAADYTVREWHIDDGLPSEDVTQLLQDRQGYLWVATRGGLARFDGSRFMTPVATVGRTTFLGLAEASDGSLLLSPRAGDPLRFAHGTVTAEPLPPPYAQQPIITSFLAADGAQWYGLVGAVLRRTATDFQVFTPEHGISPQQWTRFAADGKGRTWLASDTFLGWYENGRLVRTGLDTNNSELRIGSTRHGGPWVITSSEVLKLDDAGRAEKIAEVPPLLGAHYVAATFEDAQGKLWIGTRSQGVHEITRAGHRHVPTSHDEIFALLGDTEGNLWVGTNSGGLDVISPKIYRLYNKASGLLENATFSLCEDRDGDLWFANGDGGVARLHGTHLESEVTWHASRIFGTVAVTPALDGGVWLAGAPGIFRLRRSPADLVHFPRVPASGVRRVAFTARNGDVWLSVDPDRVGRLRGDRFETFGGRDGFVGRDLRAIAEDAHGRIWLGTSDGGLFRFDNERFERIAFAASKPTGGINSVYFGDGDDVWLGTATAGIVIFSGSRTIMLDAAHGLPGDNVTQIIADRHGYVWCGTDRGVFRLSHAEVTRFARQQTAAVTALRLGKDEGLRTVTCIGIYGPGATRSRDGRIWFATRQGVLAIDPAASVLAPAPPRVAIEALRCDGVTHAVSGPFQVPSTTRKLEIEFSVLCLSAPTRVQTRYRLDGFDPEWVLAGPEHVAAYPRLPPGEYRFSIWASFGDSAATPKVESLTFVVPPRWWQSGWFEAGALVGLVAVVATIVRAWSHRRLRRRLDKLARETAIARERARIAQNIHDDVGASLTRISLLTQATIPESAAQSENLNRIYETTREITRSLDEIVWAVNPQYDTLESFAGYLADYAQKFLSVAGIRCRLDVPDDVPPLPVNSQLRHDLFLCAREALNNIVKHAQANEVILRLAVEASQVVVVIADNGRGFSRAEPRVDTDRVAGGNGLNNMRQRMASLGGTCSIGQNDPGGTTITLEIPLEASSLSLP